MAGASRERDRARSLASSLRDAGHEVTSIWHDQDYAPGGDAALTSDERFQIAFSIELAIGRSDVIVALWPEAPSIGVYVEIGIAIAQTMPVFVCCSDAAWRGTIFTELCSRVFARDSDVLLEVGHAGPS